MMGEKIVFETIEKQLSEPWNVYYSVNWFGYKSVGRDGYYRDGEIDFLLTHPDFGVYVCEVKGGIEISIENNKWFSLNKNYVRIPIKDPFLQAKNSKHQINEKFNDETGFKIKKLHHLVIFPEINEVSGVLPFHIEDSIMLTANNLKLLEESLIMLSSKTEFITEQVKSLNTRAINWLKSKVGSNLRLKMKLKDQLNQSEQRILELSEEQSNVFDLLSY